MNTQDLQSHPLGGIFPIPSEADYQRLCESIKINGLQEAIVLYEGAILDGNSRYAACKKVRKEPHFREFNPEKEGMSAFDLVLQKNLARRNLTPSQASAIAAELATKWEEIEAAAEAEANKSPNSDLKSKAARGRPATGSKTAKAAAALGVSRTSVAEAKALGEGDPQALKDVKAGKKTLHAATQDVKKKKSKEEIASDEFAACRVIVERVYGQKDAATAEKNLKPKEFMQLGSLCEEEMLRVLPFITVGTWTLKNALSWRSATITRSHSIQQLEERALAAGGIYVFDDPAGWTVTAKRKPADPDEE